LRDEDLSDEVLDVGVISGWEEPTVNMRIAKSGRSCGYSEATVTDVNASIKVYYGAEEYCLFEDQVLTEYTMAPGDSGTCIVNVATKRAVGLGFAGSDTLSCANKMSNVIRLLNIGISSVAAPVPPMPAKMAVPVILVPILLGAALSVFLSKG
jgi:hypothetical protein